MGATLTLPVSRGAGPRPGPGGRAGDPRGVRRLSSAPTAGRPTRSSRQSRSAWATGSASCSATSRSTTSHPHAEHAAEAAEAAATQGRFWEMHDHALREPADVWTTTTSVRTLVQLGLDVDLFDKELARARSCGPGPRGLPERRAQRRERHAHLLHQRVRHDDSYDFETLLAALHGAAGIGTRS